MFYILSTSYGVLRRHLQYTLSSSLRDEGRLKLRGGWFSSYNSWLDDCNTSISQKFQDLRGTRKTNSFLDRFPTLLTTDFLKPQFQLTLIAFHPNKCLKTNRIIIVHVHWYSPLLHFFWTVLELSQLAGPPGFSVSFRERMLVLGSHSDQAPRA